MDCSQDLDYWGVPAIWLELCCETKFAARKKFIRWSFTNSKTNGDIDYIIHQ